MAEDSPQTSFRLNLSSGEISISGSEEFVTSQIRENREIIDQLLDKLSESPSRNFSGTSDTSPTEQGDTENPYPNVFTLADEEVRVIATVPGSSDREKTANVTLLYLLGKELLSGETESLISDIKPICRKQGCYNSNNFATYVKSADVVPTGSGQSQKVELTHPGRQQAEKLAQELNEQE